MSNLQEEIENLINRKSSIDKKVPFSDLVAFAFHRVIANRLNSNPKLMEIAKRNLDKWLLTNPKVEAWLEWKRLLENESLEKILEIITLESDESQRLRSSSPFVGIITKDERREIIKICEKERLV